MTDLDDDFSPWIEQKQMHDAHIHAYHDWLDDEFEGNPNVRKIVDLIKSGELRRPSASSLKESQQRLLENEKGGS